MLRKTADPAAVVSRPTGDGDAVSTLGAGASDGLRPACLIVFARAPQRGRVKTRLAATIGADAALDAHRALLARTLEIAASVRGDPALVAGTLELCIDGEDPLGECARLAARWGLQLVHQEGAHLGARMHTALARALRQGRRPVLVGSDCPVLEPRDLLDALSALRRRDAVFAPAEDGGYALVGLSRECPDVFEGIPWGGPTVMEQTRAKMRDAGIDWTELRTLWDVDAHADWLRWSGARDARA